LRRRDVQIGAAALAVALAVVIVVLLSGDGNESGNAARTITGTPTFPAPPLSTPASAPGSSTSTLTWTPTAGASHAPTVTPNGTALCAAARSGYQAATTYVGAALAGQAGAAQSCVYKNAVAGSITAYLKGKFFVPATTDDTVVEVPFTSTDGSSRITVSTAKEPDGHWYVVAVRTG
jgi:hypothetical protein